MAPADPTMGPPGQPPPHSGDEVPLGDIPELDQSELRADTLEFEPVDRRTPKKGRSKRWLLMLIVIGGLGYGGWALWGDDLSGPKPVEIPLVKAPEGPIKVRPDTPGGIEIPNRDKLVYDRLEKSPPARQAENLLPKPEQPMVAPQPVEQAKLPAGEQGVQVKPAGVESILKEEIPTASISTKPEDEEVAVVVRPVNKPPQTPEPVSQPPAAQTAAQPVTQPETPVEKPKPVATPAPPPAAPEPKTASVSSGYSIQLAAVRESAAAEREWRRLRGKHPSLLGQLTLRIVKADLGSRGIFYRLRAGPIPAETAARKLCQDLKAQKVGCLVVRPGG